MKKILKYTGLFLLLTAGLYLIMAFILQNIFSGQYKPQAPLRFLAYVSSSDIHTEFVFPVSNSLFNWKEFIPVETVTHQLHNPQYIAIGWGSRDFFFNMRTWDEIKVGVILKAIVLPGESALHIEYLKDLNESPQIYPLYLNKEEYLKLVSFIKSYFALDEKGQIQKISEFSYYDTDKFFKSYHSYHMFNTCNMWTQKGLEVIDAKRPLWAPFKYGIENAMQQKSSNEK